MYRMFVPVFVFFVMVVFCHSVTAEESAFRFVTNDRQEVVLYEGETPLWQYNAAFRKLPHVPADDHRCMAGSYIHPLYGIDGEILTADAPMDHYHHHGVFWTWPHVLVHRSADKTEEYNLWASWDRMKQLFVRFLDEKTGRNSATFRVENGWFIAPEINKFRWDEAGRPIDEKVVKEIVSVTTHRIVERNGIRARAVDFDFTWMIGKYPVTLRGAEEKSYGGLSVRFQAPVDEPKPGVDVVITIPEGVAKEDLPEKPLPWADYTTVFHRNAEGKPTGKRSGAAIFIPKTHPDYPPTWLTRYYGPLCVGWPGVEARTFRPGEVIKLSYRIWIHDGPADLTTLENAYREYTDRGTFKPAKTGRTSRLRAPNPILRRAKPRR